MKKKSYFQGGKDPEKYIPEHYEHDVARFAKPFSDWHDVYNVGGEYSPGVGLYSNFDQFKSVEDFIKNKRNKNKIKQASRKILIKNALLFSLDDNLTQNFGDIDPVGSSIVGGLYDKYLSYDFDGRPPEHLEFGRPEGFSQENAEINFKNKDLLNLIDAFLNGENTNFFGMPGGVSDSELDAVDTKQEAYHDNYSDILRDNKNIPYSS